MDLNDFGYFAKAGLDKPLEASRLGVFLAGACSGPCNIQGSRKQAMAVAGLLARRLSEDSRRQTRNQIPVAGGVHVKERVG